MTYLEYVSETATKSSCPNCFKELDKTPKRKTKCKKCGEYIFVRDSCLYTDNQIQRLNHINYFAEFGISEKEFDKIHIDLEKKAGTKRSYDDTAWYLFNRITNDPKNKSRLKMLYFDMALQLSREGKNHSHVMKQHHLCELNSFKEIGIEKVQISAGGCCDFCDATEKLVDLEQEIKNVSLPHSECANHKFNDKYGWCLCFYTAEFDFEDIESEPQKNIVSSESKSGCLSSFILFFVSIISIALWLS